MSASRCTLVFAIALGIFCELCDSSSCPNQRQTAIKLTVSSRRNGTGHWTAQAQLEHGTGITAENKDTTSPWTLNLEQTTAQCDGLESVVLTATVTAPPPRAGPGYELHTGLGYYKLHTTQMTWLEAREVCVKEGAHLAIINSEQEFRVLQNMFVRFVPDQRVEWAFLGFHDMYVEGQFITVFGEPLSTTGYVQWMSGQPDNYQGSATNPGEDCGSIHRSIVGLNDLPCTSKVPFVCEQELWEPQNRPFLQGHVKCNGYEMDASNKENIVLAPPV